MLKDEFMSHAAAWIGICVALIYSFSFFYGVTLFYHLGLSMPLGYFSMQDFVSANILRSIVCAFVIIILSTIVRRVSVKNGEDCIDHGYSDVSFYNALAIFSSIAAFALIISKNLLSETLSMYFVVIPYYTPAVIALSMFIVKIAKINVKFFILIFIFLLSAVCVWNFSKIEAKLLVDSKKTDLHFEFNDNSLSNYKNSKLIMAGDRYTAIYEIDSQSVAIVNNDKISNIKILGIKSETFFDIIVNKASGYIRDLNNFFK